MDAPRHARADYSPRHSRALPTRRYARAITPVTLVGVLALGTVSAVAVPAIHATGSGDDALASRGERHHAPWGTSGSEGLDDARVTGRDSEASDDTGGEADPEHTRSDVGPLAPVGTVPGNPTAPDLPWTPPGTDSPNTTSPAPSTTASTTASQDPSSQVPAPQASSQEAPAPAAPPQPDPSSQTPAPADSTTASGSTSTPPSTTPVDPTPPVPPAPPAPTPSTSSGSPTPGPTGPQPPSVPPTPTADPHAMPTGDLPGWTQVFADDFTRDAPLGSFLSTYASTWSAYPSPWLDTSGNGLYDPARTLTVANSMLDIHVHTANGTHLVAAPSPRLPTMTYGRYSVRFRSDPVPGYKTAWLLWPDDNVWPLHGEVDFPEGNLDQHISAFAHFAVAAGGQDAFPTSATYSGWHTATVEWTPGQLVFILDDRVIGTSTTSVPSGPMHWVLQTETQLSGGAPADSASGHVQVDWVTAYTYTP